jgi:hypothetical protein
MPKGRRLTNNDSSNMMIDDDYFQGVKEKIFLKIKSTKLEKLGGTTCRAHHHTTASSPEDPTAASTRGSPNLTWQQKV